MRRPAHASARARAMSQTPNRSQGAYPDAKDACQAPDQDEKGSVAVQAAAQAQHAADYVLGIKWRAEES